MTTITNTAAIGLTFFQEVYYLHLPRSTAVECTPTALPFGAVAGPSC